MKNSPKTHAHLKRKFTAVHEDEHVLQGRAWSEERHAILSQTQQPILVREGGANIWCELVATTA